MTIRDIKKGQLFRDVRGAIWKRDRVDGVLVYAVRQFDGKRDCFGQSAEVEVIV